MTRFILSSSRYRSPKFTFYFLTLRGSQISSSSSGWFRSLCCLLASFRTDRGYFAQRIFLENFQSRVPFGIKTTFGIRESDRSKASFHTFAHLARRVRMHPSGLKTYRQVSTLNPYCFVCLPLMSPYMKRTCAPRPKPLFHIYVLQVWKVRP